MQSTLVSVSDPTGVTASDTTAQLNNNTESAALNTLSSLPAIPTTILFALSDLPF